MKKAGGSMKRQTLEYYMDLPYTLTIEGGGESGFEASVLELPGCIAQGETQEEALRRVRVSQSEWLRQALDNGLEIPVPSVLHEAIEAAITLKNEEQSETNLEMLQLLQQIKDGKMSIDEAVRIVSGKEAIQERLLNAKKKDSLE